MANETTIQNAYDPVASKNERNILDSFFRGIDRSNLIQSIQSSVALQGVGWSEEEVLNSIGVTYDRLKSKILNINRININKNPSQVDFTNFGKMYVFFTKPDLNIFVDNNYTINPTIVDNCPDLYMRIVKNFPVAQSLQMSLGKEVLVGSGGGFMHLLGNLCSEINVPDMSISVDSGPKNQKGFSVSYAGDFWESLQENDLEFSFIDTRDKDVTSLLEIWMLYAEGVRNGSIFKKAKYINNNIVDYLSTAYIFAVDESLNIMSHIALVGVFPRSFNTSLLNYRPTQLTAQDFIGPFSTTFHVSHVSKPNSHHVVQMFNYVSGYDKVAASLGGKVAHQVMYKQLSGGYYHHTGIVMDSGFYTDYPYHFSLYDKYAEIPGVSHNVMSSGVTNYTLAFVSRNFDKAITPDSMWKGAKVTKSSRWKDGAYTRKVIKNGILTDDTTPATSYKDSGNSDYLYSRSYGSLVNVGNYPPIGIGGVYQNSWSIWNSGSNRYGTNINNGSANNNANTFRNAIRTLTGWGI